MPGSAAGRDFQGGVVSRDRPGPQGRAPVRLAAGDIVLAINPALKAGEEILRVKAREVVRTREGAYRLTVGTQVKVEGFDYRAVAEGTATLLQAIARQSNGFAVPVMTIDDWPHADYTGAMVDVARQDNPIPTSNRWSTRAAPTRCATCNST